VKIRKAVITAGGWGTRFLPVTKSQPKEMLPLVNKPVIQYSVEEAIDCGVELVVIVTSLGKRSIEDYFDRSYELEQVLEQKGQVKMLKEIRGLSNMVDITYVRQKEQLGLGHALLSARKIVGNEPFILFLPDDVFENREQVLKKMIDIYQENQGSVVAIKRVSENEVGRYGIIKPEKIGRRVFRVLDLVEKPSLEEAPSNLAIMGRYILDSGIFKYMANTSPGRNGEIQLTDGLKALAKKHSVFAYEFEGERYDAGTPLGWLQTTMALALKHPEYGPTLSEYLKNLLHSSLYTEETFEEYSSIES
jgi:UTP--glucose-1-phosphate uridylyltransferase